MVPEYMTGGRHGMTEQPQPKERTMNDRTFRWICIILSIAFLTAAFICGLADDTPDPHLFVLLLVSSGVLAVLRP